MTTYTFSVAPSNASDASFRAWASGVSAAIEAVGFVKVPYSGSADWATVLAPTSVSTYPAREVFRFDDDLQASAPIFFAVEYGSGTAVAGPGLRISLAKGVTAAGSLTGVLLDSIPAGLVNGNTTAASDASPQTHAASSCRSAACLALVMSTSAPVVGSPALILERSRSNNGVPTGDGVLLTVMQSPVGGVASAPGNPFYAVAYASGAHTLGQVPVVIPYRVAGATMGSSGSLAAGVIAPVLPWIAFAPGIAPWQPLAGLSYAPGDAVGGSIITVRALGTDRKFLVIGVDVGHNGWGTSPRPFEAPAFTSSSPNTPRQAGLMILWED